MSDSGEWYFRKMLDVPEPELKSFLDNIITQENKPRIPLTDEEERKSKIIYRMPGCVFITELERDNLTGWQNRISRRLLFQK